MSVQSDIDEPDWAAILRGVQTNLQQRIHTSLPGVIRSYDVTTQTADVQLAVQLSGHNVPPLSQVPVMWPGGAAGGLHIPLAAGDTVLVVFAEEDFSRWLSTGSVSAPAVLARHGLHAIAIPGKLRTPATVTGGHVTLAATGSTAVHLGSDGATDAIALEPGVAAILQDVITEVATVVAALVPTTAVAPAVQATFVTNIGLIVARIAAGEMAATKVKGV